MDGSRSISAKDDGASHQHRLGLSGHTMSVSSRILKMYAATVLLRRSIGLLDPIKIVWMGWRIAHFRSIWFSTNWISVLLERDFLDRASHVVFGGERRFCPTSQPERQLAVGLEAPRRGRFQIWESHFQHCSLMRDLPRLYSEIY
jgi:hypothetical protein